MNDQEPLQKTDFGAIYDQRDPRDYFNTLGQFDYQIPQLGADMFAKLLAACPAGQSGPAAQSGQSNGSGHRPTVLDVCCSYGIVGALLTTDLTIDDVYARYADPQVLAMTPDEVRAADAELVRERRLADAPRVMGLDVAANAVGYGVAVGVLEQGAVENLELADPSAELAEMAAEADLITVTGGIGYVTDTTFSRLVEAARPGVQVAAFCLRTYDYTPIAEALGRHGLVTERLPSTVRQRRFTDEAEQEWALERLRAQGLDPRGKEDDGSYHAEFFLSRPAEAVEECPIERLLVDLD